MGLLSNVIVEAAHSARAALASSTIDGWELERRDNYRGLVILTYKRGRESFEACGVSYNDALDHARRTIYEGDPT